MSASLSAVLIVSLVFGLTVILVIGLTASWLVSDVLIIPDLSHRLATNALYVASLTILITMISQVFQFILQGLHRFDRFLFLTNFGGLLLTIGNVALVWNGFGVLTLVIWNCVLVAANCGFFLTATRRLLPEFTFRLDIDASIWKNVTVYAVSIVGYQVFGNALLLFERGWITRKFGTEALTYYVVPMALGFYFHGLVASLVVVLFPVVNQMLNERNKLLRIYKTSTKIVLALTALFVVSTIFGGRDFLFVWLDQDFVSRSYAILIIHAFTFGVIAMTTISWQLTESFGMARANAIAGAVWFMISTPLMVVMSHEWQTKGVAAARLVGVVVFFGLIIYVEQNFLKGPGVRFWSINILRVLSATLAASCAEYVITSVMPPGWPAVITVGVVGTLAFGIALVAAGYIEKDEKIALMEIASKFRRA